MKQSYLEVEAAYPDERLQEIISRSEQGKSDVNERKNKVTLEDFNVEEWEKRFQLIDQMPDPDVSDLPLLERALEDEKMSIRRLGNSLSRNDRRRGCYSFRGKSIEG